MRMCNLAGKKCQAAVLLIYILEVTVSNLGWDTKYSDIFLVSLSPVWQILNYVIITNFQLNFHYCHLSIRLYML